jgi:hypothetical protein
MTSSIADFSWSMLNIISTYGLKLLLSEMPEISRFLGFQFPTTEFGMTKEFQSRSRPK